MNRALFLIFSLTLPEAASAGGVSIGFGLDGFKDLPDPKGSIAYSKFGPGGGVMFPIRVGLADWAQFRTTLRGGFAMGADRVTWARYVPGPAQSQELRFKSEGHKAWLVGAGATFGLEAYTKDEGFSPYFGAEAGPVLVNTYHSFGTCEEGAPDTCVDTAHLIPPEDRNNPNAIEPFTSQLTILTELHAGVRAPLADTLDLWVETGYSTAFLREKALSTAPEEFDARREAYGWNSVRLGIGVSLAFR